MGKYKEMLPSGLFNVLNNFKRNNFGTPQKTYSGEGEDLIIKKIFKGKRNGTYVDVGCYHPLVGSNTYLLHKNYGWTGVNIDANPETISLFNKKRPNDINLNFGVGEKNENLTFYRFTEPAVNTFSKAFYEERLKQGSVLLEEKKIEVKTLAQLLDLSKLNKPIDVLDIDVEGLDVEVIKSNNWDKYRPKLILIEDQAEVGSMLELPSYKYLTPLGYKLIFNTFSTSFYLDEKVSL
jgi:FkbM family methyltransferase